MSRTANAASDILRGASTPHMHKGTEGQRMWQKNLNWIQLILNIRPQESSDRRNPRPRQNKNSERSH